MAILTTIPRLTFKGCTSLTYVAIPSTVTSIGDNAFYGCSSLSDVLLSEGLTEIGDYAFSGCRNFDILTIPSTVTSIGTFAFDGCSGLSAIYVKAAVPPTIGANAFRNSSCRIYVDGDYYDAYCTAWADYKSRIAIQKSIVTFADDYFKRLCVSFFDNNGDGEIDYDEAAAVTTFGTKFSNDKQLEYVDIKPFRSVTAIEKDAFLGCSALSTFKSTGSIVSVGANAFKDCTSLKTIELGNNVKSIGNFAFANSGITYIDLTNVTTTALNVFENCTDLEYLKVGCKTIYNDFCLGCTSLKGLVIKEGVETIGQRAFKDAQLITWDELTPLQQSECPLTAEEMKYSLTLPSTIKNIGSKAFQNCALKTIACYATEPAVITADTFEDLRSDFIIYVPKESVDEYKNAYGWKNYASRILAFGEEFEEEGGADTPIEDTTPIVEIGDAAFASVMVSLFDLNGDGRLSEFECGKVTVLPDNCMRGNKFVENVDLSIFPNLSVIGKNAFNGCLALKNIEWNENLTKINDGAFSGCISLEHLSLDKNIKTVGNDAFAYCSSLKDVNVGSRVQSLGNRVFDGCSSLEQITFAQYPPTLGIDAFRDTNYCPLYVADAYYPYFVSIETEGWTTEYKDRVTKTSQWVDPAEYVKFKDDTWFMRAVALYDKNGDGKLTKTELAAVQTLQNSEYGNDKVVQYYDFTEFANLKTVGEEAFRGNGAKYFEFPPSLTSIEWRAFYLCRDLEYIIFHSPMPPQFGSMCFLDANPNFKLYVDDEYYENWAAANAYRSRLFKLSELGKKEEEDDIIHDGDTEANINDYTQLEYLTLSADTKGYVMTDYVGNEFSEYNFRIVPQRGTVMSVGKTTDAYGKSFYIDGDSYSFDNNGEKVKKAFIASIGDGEAYDTIEFGTDKIVRTKADGASLQRTLYNTWNGSNNSLILFSEFEDNTIKDGTQFVGKFYYLDIYERGVLHRHFVPYKKNGTDEVVLYDSVTKTVWRGNGLEFGAGPVSSLIDTDVVTFDDEYWQTEVVKRYDLNGTQTVSSRELQSVIDIAAEEFMITSSNETTVGRIRTADLSKFVNLRYIGTSAFMNSITSNINGSVTEVRLPESVTRIASGVFYKQMLLEHINIPSNLEEIGGSCFEDCVHLRNLTFNDRLTYIGTSAFKNCSTLSSVALPQGVVRIEDKTFSGCSYLSDIRLSPNTTYIGSEAFRGTLLHDMTLGINVNEIGSKAFSDCMNLDYIIMQNPTPPTVGSGLFDGCENFYAIYVDDSAVDMYKMMWEEYAEYIRPLGQKEEDEDDRNPDLVRFTDKRWKEIVLSVYDTDGDGKLSLQEAAAVTRIDDYAFMRWQSGDSFVADLSIFPNLETIGYRAFYESNKLIGVKFNDNLREIGEQAFMSTLLRDTVEFPSSLTTIGDRAFMATPLTKISIPSSVTSIGEAFGFDVEELEVYWENPTVDMFVSVNYGKTLTVWVPDGAVAAYKAAWGSTVSGSRCIFKTHFEQDGGLIFDDPNWELAAARVWSVNGYDSLNKSDVSDVVTVAADTFRDNTDIVIADLREFDKLERIGANAFHGCSNLTTVLLNDRLVTIEANAFSDCGKLQWIVLPDSVKDIGDFAFNGIKGVVNLPTNLQTIGRSAFEGMQFGASLSIPSKVTSIGNFAFSRCNINRVMMKSEVPPQIYADTFDWTYLDIYVSSSAYNTYINADIWKEHKLRISIYGEVAIDNVVWSELLKEKFDVDRDNKLTNMELGAVAKISDGMFKDADTEPFEADMTILPNLTELGQDAFRNTQITAYTIPSTVTKIGYGCFANCNRLTDVEIGDSITNLGGSCFNRCENLVSAKIGDGITTLPPYTFNMCTNLERVEFGKNMGAFYFSSGQYFEFEDCVSLKEIIFHHYVAPLSKISKDVIIYCESADYAQFNQNWGNQGWTVRIIGDTSDSDIDVDLTETVSVEDATLMRFYVDKYDTDGDGIVRYADLVNVTELTKEMFDGYTSVTKLDLSPFVRVTSIGFSAFSSFSNLSSVTLPRGLKTINANAFYGRSKLTTIVIPSSVQTIGEYAFYNCSLERVYFKGWETTSQLKTIGRCAFSYNNLDYFVVPVNVKNIGAYFVDNESTKKNFNVYLLATYDASSNIHVEAFDRSTLALVRVRTVEQRQNWLKLNNTTLNGKLLQADFTLPDISEM